MTLWSVYVRIETLLDILNSLVDFTIKGLYRKSSYFNEVGFMVQK
jgi:hypothetical protein